MTKRINSAASAIAWHVSFVFRATLCFGTAEGTFLGYAHADSHGGTSTPVLKSNFKASGFGWCTCRQCHHNWRALGWKIHSRLRRCVCIMHVCFRACTSLQPRMLQGCWDAGTCAFAAPAFSSATVRLCVSVSLSTPQASACQINRVNYLRWTLYDSTAKTHTPNPFECWNTRGAECRNMQHLEPQVIRAKWRERAICSLNASVRLFFNFIF